MNLLMVSGDRQVAVGEKGPFHSMQAEFSRYFGRIDVLCPRPDREPTVAVIHDNVYFHTAPCSRRHMPAWIADEGSALIAAHDHKLIVSHDYGFFYNGVGSAFLMRKTGVPYLSELHHVPGYPIAVGLRERIDRLAARVYVRWARKQAAAFRVVNTEQMPELLRRWGVPEGRIMVLPSQYIDFTVFRPAPKPVPARYDLCFVGRMVANKRVDCIMKAMAVCAGEGQPLRAVFVGRGELRDRWKAQGERLGVDCTWIEWVDEPSDLADIYRESRSVVCASTCEGGPRYTVEAMACGVPAVSTPVGVMGDLLGDGSCGALVGFDEYSLAAGLKRVLENEQSRLTLGQRAIDVCEPYEYARALKVYANGLRGLAGEPEMDL
ncbi:MAG: glycosyltransferase involved in cell wall biosynthesis [Planctomycetota bacterium]|jgi:glycosyltransferase involved in cell wall biosynthesis